MRDWLIVGGGGHALSVFDVIVRRGDRVAGWVLLSDEAPPGQGKVFDTDLAGATAAREHGWSVALGVGSNRGRDALLAMYGDLPDQQLEPLVAATATVSPLATLGPCVQVFEHAHVGPRARLDAGVLVNTAANVEHEAVIGTAAHVAPGSHVLGGATLGVRSMLGSGARVLPAVRVGNDITVGAAAVVTRDLSVPGTYVGQPARPTVR